DVSTEVLLGDSVAETLLERSARDDCDMIALSTHGRGGLRRWAFGSVADRLVRQADTPVFVVREANPPVNAG
ncbi:MAG: universal stress protein, partial [Chloroflexi bacterium]|nr:universal stress protein [Chloroflexota bacterium]